jgi:D-glycero-alpha-D-manno-heptose-7-phosphate kinase
LLKIRSKAPLRLGLAGGGTDVSPYSDRYGGCVLNATINMYAHAYISDSEDSNTLILEAKDLEVVEIVDLRKPIVLEGKLLLHRAIYKRIMNDFNEGVYIPLKITTYSDAPPGSGLGSSSTMVVSIIEGLRQLLSLPLGEYDIAHLAYEIERIDCRLSGGKQDQYAATFGGFNFIEFYEDDRVIVNPLRIRNFIKNELESSLVLYFTGVSRDSATIIDDQMKSLASMDQSRLEAMHQVKLFAYSIKEQLFKADIKKMAEKFRLSWEAKKSTSASITNTEINSIEKLVLANGALAMKVSGAGGGGFIMIFVDPENKLDVVRALDDRGGHVKSFEFTSEGVQSWCV